MNWKYLLEISPENDYKRNVDGLEQATVFVPMTEENFL